MYELASDSLPHLEIDVAATARYYEKCARCMYLHAHGVALAPLEKNEGETALVNDLMRSAQGNKNWIELNAGISFRVLSHRESAFSVPVPFQLAQVSYTGTYDAITELDDGRKILVKYILPGDKVDTSRFQRELTALTYALEHPRDRLTPPVRIDGHALLTFGTRQVMVRGRLEKHFLPVSWTELERRPDRFLSFMRVVTGILALAHEPPRAPGCAECRHVRYDTAPTPAGHPKVTPAEAL